MAEAGPSITWQSSEDLILVANPDGRVVFANDACLSMLGYGVEEALGMQLLEFHPPMRRKEAGDVVEAMLRGERGLCTIPLLHKNGSEIPAETRVWVGKWGGETCLFGVCRSLEGVQEAQERFQKLFRCNPTPLALSGLKDPAFFDVNDAFLALLGFGREEVIGHTVTDLSLFVQPDAQAAVAARLVKAGRVVNEPLKVRHKDGHVLDGLFSGEIVTIQGEPFLLTVMVDITDIRED